MDTAMVGSRPTESVLTNSGGRRRSSRAEAKAAALVEWADDVPDPTTSTPFAARMSVEQVEEGFALAPKFDADGLIPCITTDANAGEVLVNQTRTSMPLNQETWSNHSRLSVTVLSSFLGAGKTTLLTPLGHPTRWGQDERNETPSGPIFGLAVSQGAERTC